jgi:hypothetical protein
LLPKGIKWVRLLKAQLFNIGQRREEDFIVNKSVVNNLVFKVFVIRAIGQKVQFLLEATYSISCVVDHFSKQLMNKGCDNSKFVFDPRIIFIIEDDIVEVSQVIVWVDEQTVDCKRL